MIKRVWEDTFEKSPELMKEAYDSKAFHGAGVIEEGLLKGLFEMGEDGEDAFMGKNEGDENSPQLLDLYKIPKLDQDKQENYRLLSEAMEGNFLDSGERFSAMNKETQKEVLTYVKDTLVWSANYMMENYGVGMPRALSQELDKVGDSWKNFMDFVQWAQKYSGSPRKGFLVCRILKISKAFHEVNSHADLARVKKETDYMGRLMAQNIPVLDDKEESWSAGGLERETGMYVDEGDPAVKANIQKKKFIQIEKQKTSRNHKRKTIQKNENRRSLSVSFVDENNKGHDFQILAAYFNTKEIQRMVGKRLRKPEMSIDRVLNDGARGRIMVRPSDMADAQAWFETMGFTPKGGRGTISDRSEIVVGAMRLKGGQIIPGYNKEGKMRPSEEGAVALEMQIVSAGDFERTETGVQNHKIFSVVQATQELMADGSISNNKMKSLQKKAYNNSLRVFPKGPVSEDKIKDRFEKEFFFNRKDRRWYSYEQMMRAGLSEIYPEGRLKILVDAVEDEVFDDNVLSELSQKDWRRLFETRELPGNLSLEVWECLVAFLSERQFGKVFRQRLKTQLKARQVVENE